MSDEWTDDDGSWEAESWEEDESWEDDEEYEDEDDEDDEEGDDFVEVASTSTADLVRSHVGGASSAIQVEVVTSFGLVRYAVPAAVVPVQVAVAAVAPFVITESCPGLDEDRKMMRACCAALHKQQQDCVSHLERQAKLVDAVLEQRSAEKTTKARVKESKNGAAVAGEDGDVQMGALAAKIKLVTRRSEVVGTSVAKQLRAWRQSASCVEAELKKARELTVPLAMGRGVAAKLAKKVLKLPVCSGRMTPESRTANGDVTQAVREVTLCLASCVASDVKRKSRGPIEHVSRAWAIPAAPDGCREVDKKGKPLKTKGKSKPAPSAANCALLGVPSPFCIVLNATARLDQSDHLAATATVSVRPEPTGFAPQGSTSVAAGAHTVQSMNVDFGECADEAEAAAATPAVLRALFGPSHPLCTALTDIGLTALCIALIEGLDSDLDYAVQDAHPRMLGLSKKKMLKGPALSESCLDDSTADAVAAPAADDDGDDDGDDGEDEEAEEEEEEEEEEEQGEEKTIPTDNMVPVDLTAQAILRTTVPDPVVPAAVIPVLGLFITANLKRSIVADHTMLRNMALFTTPKVFHEETKRRVKEITWDDASAAEAIVDAWKNTLWVLYVHARSALCDLLAGGISVKKSILIALSFMMQLRPHSITEAARFIADRTPNVKAAHQIGEADEGTRVMSTIMTCLTTLSITSTRDFEWMDRKYIAIIYTPAASDGTPVGESIVEDSAKDADDALRPGARTVALNICVSFSEESWRGVDARITVTLATPLASEMTELRWREPMFFRAGKLVSFVQCHCPEIIKDEERFNVSLLRSALGPSHPLCTSFTDYGLAEMLLNVAKVVVPDSRIPVFNASFDDLLGEMTQNIKVDPGPEAAAQATSKTKAKKRK